MSTKLETIKTFESAKEAAKKMVDRNVSSLVVMDRDGLAIGILTERDIARGVCTHDVLSKEFKVEHLMTSPLSTIDADSSMETAASLMLQKKIRHVLVKDGDKPVGIITATNFIDHSTEQGDALSPNNRVLKTLKDEI
jgi:signal-transduction protein with cAMP-binding, CBS, and nucleotidyltransferase domain